MKIIKKIQVNEFQLMIKVEIQERQHVYVIPYCNADEFERLIVKGQLSSALSLGYDVLSGASMRVSAS
jgi:hypothetical protein